MNRMKEWTDRWIQAEEKAGVAAADRTFYRAGREGRSPVLLLHGGGGSPQDLHPLADDLERRGIPTLCPLLPFHALGEDAMKDLRFEDLVERALAAHEITSAEEIPADRERGAVIGLSLGAVLGIRLAVERPVARFVALAPALQPYVFRRALGLVPRMIRAGRLARIQYRWQQEVWRGIRATKEVIPRVTCPLLVVHSTDDASVSVKGARLLYDRAASSEKRLVLVKGQGHVLTQAPEPEKIFTPVRDFLGT